MRRLYLKVWAALVVAVFVSLLGGALTARFLAPGDDLVVPAARTYAEGLGAQLAQGDAQSILAERALEHDVRLALFAADRTTLIASSEATPLALPRPRELGDHWVRSRHGAGFAFELDDGRWLVIGHPHASLATVAHHLVPVLAVVFGLLAATAWPIARMTTRRLEELRAAVDDLGRGDLSRRVPVEGADEVAELARSFNDSAARIEALVAGQRRVLAAASHELRSPLARIRMAAELALEGDPARRAEWLARIDGDITELDGLIDDVLLASRLDAGAADPPRDAVDLGALARDEAARVGAAVRGVGHVIGDDRMLRRLLRNLLENASRHGAPPIEVAIEPGVLTVRDAGPGIVAEERERVFEPFYRPQGHSESDGGVGLGLSLARRIAVHHGASIFVDDGPGGVGTCIVVRWDEPDA